ncbi:hypothetical protein RNJ44_01170 [Nakaseomyces bracarensis]|uniref:separase n=1 Tax=Nakaseomyces bracarensis TaxID=273131 RepID=A0ABR4NRD3_9SACH
MSNTTLNEVDLNATWRQSKSQMKTDDGICKLADISGYMNGNADFRHDKLIDWFDESYVFLVKAHDLKGLRTLIKQHLVVIVKLINQDLASQAIRHVTSLYNHTNLEPISNISDVLLTDFTMFNVTYLSSLKVLVLQIILKRKLSEHYLNSIIKLFANDERYLLRDIKFKVNTVLKLLLNFYTILPKYRILFGLKFLQYLKQFNISFELYVKNMTRDTYQRQIVKAGIKYNGTYEKYFNSFYLPYSKYCNTVDKIMVSDILNTNDIREKILKDNKLVLSLFDLDIYSIKYYCLSVDEMKILLGTLLKNNYLFDSRQTVKSLSILLCVWKALEREGYEFTKVITKLLDKTIIFLNNINDVTEKMTELIILLSDFLINICLNKSLLVPITNITTVLFNLSVKYKNETLLAKAVDIEILFTLRYKEMETMIDFDRVNKMLSGTASLSLRHQILSKIFNILTFSSYFTFARLFEAVEKFVISCKKRIRNLNICDLPMCSKTMTIMLANFLGKELPENYINDESLTLLDACLSGKCKINTSDLNKKEGVKNIISESYNLLKCIYLLNYDISKCTSTYVVQITDIITNNNVLTGGDNSFSLQENFLKNLFTYLDLLHYDKIIITLIEHLEMNGTSKDIWSFFQSIYLRALVRLQYTKKIDLFYTEFLATLSDDYLKCCTKDILTVAFEFVKWYQKLDVLKNILEMVPKGLLIDVFNYGMNDNLSVDEYLLKLICNIRFYRTLSIVYEVSTNKSDAVETGRLSLQLIKSILKNTVPRKMYLNMMLINELTDSLTHLLGLYSNIGLERDASFYAKELTNNLDTLNHPRVVYSILIALLEYYRIKNDDQLSALTKDKANSTFNFINGEFDVNSTTIFLFINNEHSRILESLYLFFGSDIDMTNLRDCWFIKLGDVVNLPPKSYENINSVNQIRKSYSSILEHIDMDPIFKGLSDSILSTHYKESNDPMQLTNNSSEIIYGAKKSSNMTPKRKNLKKDFDKKVLVSKLQQILDIYCKINPFSLNRNHLLEVTNILTICSLLLNCTQKLDSENYNYILNRILQFRNVTRQLPFYYEHELSRNKHIRKNWNDYLNIELKPLMIDLNANLIFSKLNWKIDIIQLDYCTISHSLIITKICQQSNNPLVIKVPLNRSFSRDPDFDYLSFEDAIKEIEDIINSSNTTVSRETTDRIRTKEDRHEWWEKRYNLDERLRDLCEKIEHSWINGLKGLFLGYFYPSLMITKFRASLNDILEQVLPSRKNGECKKNNIDLKSWVISLFLSLDPNDKNFMSSLEDLIYFVLDILLYQGEENAYDEIDFGLMHVLIEEQIRSFRLEYFPPETVDHTFIIVGNMCHNIPWESLSLFKDRSTSRVPSLSSLFELLEKHKYQLPILIDKKKHISMIVNPNSDLTRTENKFKDIFSEIESTRSGSKLLVNQKPSESQFLDFLKANVFIYIGHGGGEQYIRHSVIKQCDYLPPVFLLGCSSASMRDNNILHSTCISLSYIIGSSPMVVGNLWDVTDKDIDKFSISVFEKTALTSISTNHSPTTVTTAVSQSRDTCHLKYLNGAAPVVYGLPVLFT